MRFMMIVKPPAYTGLPDPAQFEAMGRYNEELQRAGVLLDLNGLAPSDPQAITNRGRRRRRDDSDDTYAASPESDGANDTVR